MIDLLKPYPSYKDSGVERLGEVPEHWRIRHLGKVRNGTGFPLHLQGDRKLEIPFLKVKHLARHGIGKPIVDSEHTVSRETSQLLGATIFSRKTIVFAKIGAASLLNRFSLLGRSACIDNNMGALVLDERLARPEYVLLALGQMEMESIAQPGPIPTLSLGALRNYVIPLPSKQTQDRIVHFLDHATNQIDRLIQAQQKLIELLKELKQTTIQEAVTGRIDVQTGKPYTQYKDSGVDWLSKVPQHWQVRRLRSVAKVHFSNVDKHIKAEEQPVRLCNYVDVYHNDHIHSDMDFMRATASTDEINRFRLDVGDVLITKDSEVWNDIGVPALVESTDFDLVCGYHLAKVRPIRGKLHGSFLHAALSCPKVAVQFHICANGVTRFGLSQGNIKSILLPVPPHPEQSDIARFLDQATNRIEKAIEGKTKKIELLKEYQTRMIADVVTGKVDVRAAAADLPDSDLVQENETTWSEAN